MEKQTVQGLMLELIKLVADGCVNIVKGYELAYDCSMCNEKLSCTTSCIKNNKKPDCLMLNSDDM